MTAKWGSCTILALCLVVLLAGCRTTQPDVKPAKTPEKLVAPPLGMYGSPQMPALAFDKQDDPARRLMDLKAIGVVPASGSGSMGGPGMGGPGGRSGGMGGGY